MRKLHLLVVGIILPALLAACQNTQSSSNGYGVALVNQSLDVRKQFETLAGYLEHPELIDCLRTE